MAPPSQRTKETIFLAHSFARDEPNSGAKSDAEVVEWFTKLIRKKWNVNSGKGPQARPIREKVLDAVSESKAMIGLFTRRHKLEGQPDAYLPAPWLLCECAYALAFFRHHDYDPVAGFREKGIDSSALAMLTSDGMEFPEFDRDRLEQDKAQFTSNRSHPPALLPPAPWQGVDSSSTTVLVARGM